MKLDKIYKVAFTGNKTNRLKEIVDVIEDGDYTKIYEPFGGSCCISINLRANNIVNKAVANDYDDFIVNLEKNINIARKIINETDKLDLPPLSDKTMKKDKQKELQDTLSQFTLEELQVVKNCFCFRTPKFKNLIDFKYNSQNYNFKKYEDYLEKSKLVEYDKLDYDDFIDKYQNEFDDKTLLIVDPPYLNSTQTTYNNEKYFGLTETINLLRKLKALKINFIFFNQIKDDTIALLDLLELDFEIYTKIHALSGNKKRDDVMAVVTF